MGTVDLPKIDVDLEQDKEDEEEKSNIGHVEDVIRKSKKKATIDKANIFSRITFWWVQPWLSKRGNFSEDDLHLCDSEDARICYARFMEHWSEELREWKDTNARPSLGRALRKSFWKQFVIAAVFKLFWGIFLVTGAFYFVRSLLQFVQDRYDGKDVDIHDGWLYACFFFLDCMLLSICLQQMTSHSTRLGIRVRGALITAVYNKALVVENAENIVGDILNLVANDCNRLLEGCSNIHYLWSGPLEALAIIALLIYLIRYPALVGLGLLLLIIPVQYIMGAYIATVRRRTIGVTDKRIHVMHEVLLAVKLVKFYAWEKSFSDEVAKLRKKELALLRKSAMSKSFNLVTVFALPPLLALGIFGTYIATEGDLVSTIAFTTLSMFNTLRFPLVVLPKALRGFAESLAAVHRIQKFLLQPELVPRKKSSQTEIVIKNANFSIDGHTLLHDINFEVPRGKLASIVGPVGSGKSTVINAILGNIKLETGECRVGGRIAYVPQTPWIQHATVRDNILFGKPYNAELYQKVIFACALQRDLEILVNGDKTEIGERGINLSGGQKQRIALARAVYSDADVILLDSPLSAVDQHTGTHIFTHCIKGMLAGKTVVLVNHNLSLLPKCDYIGIMKKGRFSYYGPFDPEVMSQHYPDWHKYGSVENAKTPMEVPHTTNKSAANHITENRPPEKGGATAYIQWAKVAKIPLVLLSLLIFIITQVTRIISDWWISQWTLQAGDHPQSFYISVYGALVGFFVVMLFIRGVVFYTIALRTASKLHNHMFKNVLKAPISFFTITPLGPLLNCFSKDQDAVDESLPDTVHMTIIYFMILLTTLTLVCIQLPWYSIIAGTLLVGFVLLQMYYMKTSRILRAIVGNTNSPIFAHVSESLHGIAVVKAFEAEDQFKEANIRLVNRNHRAQFSMDHLQLWLAFRLDTMASLLVLATCLFCVGDDELQAAAAGLAISNSLQKLVFFTLAVKGVSDIDATINAVERIKHYTEVDQEKETKIRNLPQVWPHEGKVRFKKSVMRYFPHMDPVLRSVDIKIKPRQKVGICGRTGSGKTSLIMALFRLVNLDEGQVKVDGLDISELGLQEFRSRIAIIPQEPVMFKGSIRSNLDPFNHHTDKELWHSLELSHLKASVEGFEKKLETEVEENGNNFSLGQRQLFCLARAILNNSKVIVLDEATSAIDLETDALIQKTIRKVFADRTVLTIAHRMDTILDSDKILVMDAGNVAEFASPWKLLSDRSSKFYSLVEQSGLTPDDILKDYQSSGSDSSKSSDSEDERIRRRREKKARKEARRDRKERKKKDKQKLETRVSTEQHNNNNFM